MNRFGEKLRSLRQHASLSQQELGEALEVNQTFIGKMERGEKIPNAAMILKISEYFDVSADRLMKDYLELEE